MEGHDDGDEGASRLTSIEETDTFGRFLTTENSRPPQVLPAATMEFGPPN
jgi:hypothetical protein